MTTLAADTFTRTVTGGWGTADTGGAWTVTSGTYFTTNGTQGVLSTVASNTAFARLASVSSTSSEVVVNVGFARLPDVGNIYLYIHPRSLADTASASTSYGFLVQVASNGVVTLFERINGVSSNSTATGITVTAADRLTIRARVNGVSPTTLAARVWKSSTAEPGTWQINTTDTTSGLQDAGGIALGSYLSSSVTNGPINATWDGLTAATVTNAPPTVSAGGDQTATVNTTVTLNGTASDTDGTITSTAWTVTAYPGSSAPTITGASSLTASFTPTVAGLYTFQLAAKDNNLATGTDVVNIYVPAATVAPNGQVENSGAWTGAYADLADSSDTTCVQSSGTGTDTFSLAPATQNSSATLTIRAGQTGTGASLVVTLLQGTTTVASWTLNSLTATPTDYPLSLTATQVAAITNWNVLRLRFS